jgi:hypothetical protein
MMELLESRLCRSATLPEPTPVEQPPNAPSPPVVRPTILIEGWIYLAGTYEWSDTDIVDATAEG